MSYIDTNLLDNYFENLPNLMLFDGLTCWDSFCAIFKSSEFYLYDSVTLELLNSIYEKWAQLTTKEQPYYESHQDGLNYIFAKRKRHQSDAAQDAWDDIGKLSSELRVALGHLIQNIK
ncbi:TPA: hypothetical protein U2J86_005150 [Serratia marcescens]|nr:hypothetical protein [Serratia marcescens]